MEWKILGVAREELKGVTEEGRGQSVESEPEDGLGTPVAVVRW